MKDPVFSEPVQPFSETVEAPPVDTDISALEKHLSRTMLRTVTDWNLLEHGDRVMVAVSGGKDSYTMLDLLAKAQRRSPVKYELIAFHLDQAQPGYDGRGLKSWLEASGIRHVIHREDTYSIVLEQVEGTDKAYCGPCSRFRRGIIYTQAEKLGCTKIALGHHRDDALETLLLNLFYSGKLQAMPPGYVTQDERFRVIRPLIECDQESIAAYAKAREFPIIPCNLCGSQDGLKRARMRKMLTDLSSEIPNLKSIMTAALKNVRPTHLWDAEVGRAWDAMAKEFSPRV